MSLILLVIALVLFVSAAAGASFGKINLIAAGLAFLAAAQLAPALP